MTTANMSAMVRAVELPAPVVIVPPDVTAFVEAVVRARSGESWRRVLEHMRKRRHYPLVAGLRHEIGWMLHALGHRDAVVAKALGVDRTTVVGARRTFAAKLERDEALAERVWRVVGDAAEERRAA